MKNNSLHNIKNSGFKTPQDYFNNLDDTFFTVSKLKNNVENSGFKVPDKYFENLETAVLQNVLKQKEPVKVISIFNKKNLLYATSIAAAVVLLFSLTLFKNTSNNWNTLDIDTVENYVLNDDISTYEIASLLTEDDLTEENFISSTFNEENMETYLLNNFDIEDFVE
ncbi:hypothetical protein PK35_05545 [Tamlana nanhaiensis]|uniref:Uncharacterized protein n=1 Tax=Neotamlana nanhaiensis TaxID=1382798 RepID=A0A0D7W3Q0_9FLAO|nr:hypothetical protein [Tamlana nanhaiensis]KJD33323.1 hypothetical protein PK35_05545 [Tamlana nanhaiensis]